MCYDKALRILARLEYPWEACGGGNGKQNSRLAYEEWVNALVEKKFCHIVSAQVSMHAWPSPSNHAMASSAAHESI